jgi:NADH-quinone oxidoreductase subunit K
MVPFSHILVLSGILFALGVACVSIRRNILMILIGVEVMLNGAGLAFVAGSMRWMAADGQVFVLFLTTMAASEVSIGLAMVVYLHKRKRTVNIEDFNEMKG